jgi:hypothetical protein
MADDGKQLPDHVAQAAKGAAQGAKDVITPPPAVFPIAEEAKRTANLGATRHGDTDKFDAKGTTLTEAQFDKYEQIMQLYRKSEGRLTNPKWTAENQKDFRSFTDALKGLEKENSADRTAIMGKLVYQGLRSPAQKGDGLLADLEIYNPSLKDMKFTDQKGNNVDFKTLASKTEINVNTSGVGTPIYDVHGSEDRFADIQRLKEEALKVKARDDAASHKKAGPQRQ